MSDLDRLDELAAATTGEPWDFADWLTAENHEYIAACDPAAIRSLVAAVRERDELRDRPVDVEMIAASLMDPLVGPIVAALLAKHGITLTLHREDGA